MSQQPAEGMARHCIGRFCLDVPASMARSADAYKVQGVSLEEVSWAPAAKEPWEQEWRRRLGAIEALESKREEPTDAQGAILELRMFKPGALKGAYYCATELRELGTWGALLNAGSGGLWLQIDSDPEHKEEGAQRVGDLAAGYRVADPKVPLPVPGKDGFYLRQGSLALPFKLAEEAHARFSGHPLKLDLSVTIETTFAADRRGLMQRFASALEKSGASLSGAAIPVRNKKREVAGLSGEEMILKTSEGKRTLLAFLWRTPGEERSGKHPEVVIEMETGADNQDEKVALWDGILESMKPVL